MGYSVEVSDHVMVAHSLRGEVFGPAQRMHGATFVVWVAFMREELDPDRIVVDIGRAGTELRAILDKINYRNLDEVGIFAGQITTTEFLCKWIFDQFAASLAAGTLGPHATGVNRLRVTLIETPTARASYEGAIKLA